MINAMIRVSCDLCGTDAPTHLFRARDINYHYPGIFNIVRCTSCSLVYLNPRPADDELGLYYPDQDYTCFAGACTPAALGISHPFTRALASVGLHGGRLCDIGCGTGAFLAAAAASGWNISGVEPNTYARELSKRRLGADTCVSSFAELNCSESTFDVITLWHTLEHLPSPQQTLFEINRLLKPGGILALAVPNLDSFESHVWKSQWIALMPPTHLYHFTARTLTQYMLKCGFELLYIHQAPAANSLAANVLRTLRALLLDPVARTQARRATSTAISASSDRTQTVMRRTNYYKLEERTKDRVRGFVTSLLFPMAWTAARLGSGPELTVYARKL
jgi:2-polyprenyl-3-methyl-5-hydroxy-6-metoxy-1,4-benzoquinol methylase